MNITLKRFTTGARRIATMVVVVAAASTILNACNNTQDDSIQTPTTNAIQFATTINDSDWNATRAQIYTPASLPPKIGIYGYSHTDVWSSAAATAKPDYFVNKGLLRTGSTWAYDGPQKYWPTDPNRKVSFFAYAPFSDVNPAIVLTPASASTTGAPKLTYTTPQSVSKHVDLMWASSPNLTSGTVSLAMQHALARIEFKVKLDTEVKLASRVVNITKLTLTNIKNTGTLDITTQGVTPTWNLGTGTPSDFSIYAGDGIFDLKLDASGNGSPNPFTASTQLNTADGIMLIIPQQLNGSKIKVEYNFTDSGTGTITYHKQTFSVNTITLTAGSFTNYVLTLNDKKQIPVSRSSLTT